MNATHFVRQILWFVIIDHFQLFIFGIGIVQSVAHVLNNRAHFKVMIEEVSTIGQLTWKKKKESDKNPWILIDFDLLIFIWTQHTT